MTVTLKLPITGGLYRFSEVAYRGLHVGTVTGINLTSDGADATLSLTRSVEIPANLQAEVRSVSPAGEQYVDLRPRTDSAPYLHDGSVIEKSDAVTPQPVGPMLDQVSALIGSIPKDRLGQLLDDSFQAFDVRVMISGPSSIRRQPSPTVQTRFRIGADPSSTTRCRCLTRRCRPPMRYGRGHTAWQE